MTRKWPPLPAAGPRLFAAACLSLGLLAAPPALAQGAGAGGTGTGQLGQGPQGRVQQQPNSNEAHPGRTPRERIELQQQERAAAPSSDRAREQLRELNQLSRELAPSAPVPAPDLRQGGGGGNR